MQIETIRILKAVREYNLTTNDVIKAIGFSGDLSDQNTLDLIERAILERRDVERILAKINHLGYRKAGGQLSLEDWIEVGQPKDEPTARGMLAAKYDETYAYGCLGEGPIVMPPSLIDDGNLGEVFEGNSETISEWL